MVSCCPEISARDVALAWLLCRVPWTGVPCHKRLTPGRFGCSSRGTGPNSRPSAQHHCFLFSDQPLTQFSVPALQSYMLATAGPSCPQPLPCSLQHQIFFSVLQPAFQLKSPSAQLYGSTGPMASGAGGCVGKGFAWETFCLRKVLPEKGFVRERFCLRKVWPETGFA